MKRREFIMLLGGIMLAPPARLMGQPADRVYRVALLAPFPASRMAAFFDELRQHGFAEGQDLTIDHRGSEANFDRFPALAVELVNAAPDAILSAGVCSGAGE